MPMSAPTYKPAPGYAADATVDALGDPDRCNPVPARSLCRRRKSAADASVGLLARRVQSVCSAAASPSPAYRRVVVRSETLTHSGGTAPELHRASLLCPSRAPKRDLPYITSRTLNQIASTAGGTHQSSLRLAESG